MCSTIHKAYKGDTVEKRVKKDGEWKTVDFPVLAAVKDCLVFIW